MKPAILFKIMVNIVRQNFDKNYNHCLLANRKKNQFREAKGILSPKSRGAFYAKNLIPSFSPIFQFIS